MAFADIWDDEGWWSRTVIFGTAIYASRCPECACFVKVDSVAKTRGRGDEQQSDLAKPNATCKKHGRVTTPFLGWCSDAEE